MIRRGEEIPTGVMPDPIGMLLPVPLFHITGERIAADVQSLGHKWGTRNGGDGKFAVRRCLDAGD